MKWLITALVLLSVTVSLACGSDDNASPDPFARTFRDGTYTRTRDGKVYKIAFGVSIGRYVLTVDGAEQRRGTYTQGFAPGEDGQAVGTETRMAMIDEGEFEGKCAPDQEPGAYRWQFKNNKLTLESIDDECERRKGELESRDWLYEGPLPTATP
jgi:hypothetical protein